MEIELIREQKQWMSYAVCGGLAWLLSLVIVSLNLFFTLNPELFCTVLTIVCHSLESSQMCTK